MSKKWLLTLDRIVIWPLLFVTIVKLLSGYSLTYHYYAYKIIPQGLASKIHTPFCWLFIIMFLLHFFIAAYFAVIRKPSKTRFVTRLARLSAWLLFVSVFMIILSGYGITGKLRLFPALASIKLHSTFSLLFILFFVLHAGINSYLILKEKLSADHP